MTYMTPISNLLSPTDPGFQVHCCHYEGLHENHIDLTVTATSLNQTY